MQAHYDFTAEQLAKGKTVMFYDRRANDPRKLVKDMGRLAMVGDVLHVDGRSVKGWTMAVAM